MKIIFTIVIITIVVLILRLGLAYLRHSIKSKYEYGEAAKAFFDAMDPFLNNKDTPIELLNLTRQMSALINDRTLAKMMFMCSINEKWNVRNQTISDEKRIIKHFLEKNSDLAHSYKMMFVSWFLAVTALSPVYGNLARVAISEQAIDKTVSKTANKTFLNKNTCHDHFAHAV